MKKIKKFFLTTFAGGLVALLPLSLIIIIGTWVYSFVSNVIDPVSNVLSDNTVLSGFLATLITIAGILVLFFLVGILVRTKWGMALWHRFERWTLYRIPLYKFTKVALDQFSNREKSPFRQVAYAKPFENDTAVVSFVTDEFKNGDYMVFVPTAPNPTNGNMYRVAGDQVELMDIPVSVAMNAIISCGAGTSKFDEVVNARKTKQIEDKQ